MTSEPSPSREPGRLHSAVPFGRLFDRLGRAGTPADVRRALREAAQLALQVEFAMVPVYLSGLYSIVDAGSGASRALQDVVTKKMSNVNQAANLVVALGGQPRFTGACSPAYPGWLPHANERTTPFIGLCRASADVFLNVYAAIEAPAPWDGPARGERYDTIAQLYRALADAIAATADNPFQPAPAEFRQRTDIDLGQFGGAAVEVHDKASALAAIERIVRQGERGVPAGLARETSGRYGGPIPGTPVAASHFIELRHVVLAAAGFPPTLPIVSNPRLSDFTNPAALQTARLFNRNYSVMLHGLELSFVRGDFDPFFGVVLNLMHEVLPSLAAALMNTPAHAHGDAAVGPNAAPTWSWDEAADARALAPALQQALDETPVSSRRAPHLARAWHGLRKLAIPVTGQLL